MPSKSLPDPDADILDLNDLAEEKPAGRNASGDNASADMSFEQELDDLFGDVEPSPSTPSKTKPAAKDDDLIDLSGLELDAPGKDDTDADVLDLEGFGGDDDKATAQADDDVLDLAGFDTDADEKSSLQADDGDTLDLAGLELDDEPPAKPAAKKAAPHAADDDVLDLAGFDTDADDTSAFQADGEDSLDLAGLELDDDTASDKKAAAKEEDDDFLGLFGDEEATGKPLGTPDAASEALFDTDDLEPPVAKAGPTAKKARPLPDEAMDLSEMSVPDFGASAKKPKAIPMPADAEPEMADVLGDLPEAPEATRGAAATKRISLDAATDEAPQAPAKPKDEAIDLGALDQLIDTAQKPLASPETAVDTEQFAALTARLTALESTMAALADKIGALSVADPDALSALETTTMALADKITALPSIDPAALTRQMEAALTNRLETMLASLPPAPDVAAIKADVLAASQAAATEERASLHDALARLETQTQERQAHFETFAATVESRLADLHQELPQPGAFATADTLTASLETLRENLSRDIAGRLDERLGELRRELRETLGADITASLEERLALVTEKAHQSAREEAQAVEQALSGRLEALESERIDPEALAERVRQALGPTPPDSHLMALIEEKIGQTQLDAAIAGLRDEVAKEILKAVPKAAAAIIREEIAALAKELQ